VRWDPPERAVATSAAETVDLVSRWWRDEQGDTEATAGHLPRLLPRGLLDRARLPPMDVDRYRVPEGSLVRLKDWSTDDTATFDGNKSEGNEELAQLNERLTDLQGLLYAQQEQKVLVVLQGMDTSGKDGTIKHVFRTVNPLGVRVRNFVKPNSRELAHDYLWRVHAHTPSSGTIAIFNRSHYEDVLVVRVHQLVDEAVWSRRYRHIVEFERMLAEEGAVILKFFLHISKDEQRERLQERLSNPKKQWKFEHGDIEERKRWDDYQEAYEVAISRTSTEMAPWYIVPSDRKWYRNLVINQVLVNSLEALDMRYPEPSRDLAKIHID
jgi:PPK2 family polyphosphate:nucleotide phosphotransferase